ncbi:MAG TPA: hypothetical protein VME67_26725 [Mycobacterium sp.]|nr:hypothetical protein [Mycobacterium sp.]HTX98110.1 hypothetical protein [Mycobacterium sp.]
MSVPLICVGAHPMACAFETREMKHNILPFPCRSGLDETPATLSGPRIVAACVWAFEE